jgi:hypothetical protein
MLLPTRKVKSSRVQCALKHANTLLINSRADRTVRKSLLESIDTYVQNLTAQTIEEQIFVHLQVCASQFKGFFVVYMRSQRKPKQQSIFSQIVVTRINLLLSFWFITALLALIILLQCKPLCSRLGLCGLKGFRLSLCSAAPGPFIDLPLWTSLEFYWNVVFLWFGARESSL